MFTGIHGVSEPEWRSNCLVPGRNQGVKVALAGLKADDPDIQYSSYEKQRRTKQKKAAQGCWVALCATRK